MVLHVSPCVDGVLTHELSSSLTQPPLIPQCSKLADRPEAQHASAFGPAAAVRAGEQPNRAGGVVRRFPQLVHVIGERGSMALAPQLMRDMFASMMRLLFIYFSWGSIVNYRPWGLCHVLSIQVPKSSALLGHASRGF